MLIGETIYGKGRIQVLFGNPIWPCLAFTIALHDNGRAMLIGETTHGKGRIQVRGLWSPFW